MSKLEKYPKYKDSGVEWIREVPEHWKIIRLTNIGRFSSSGIDKHTKQNESKVKIVNFTDIFSNTNYILDSSIKYMVVSTPEENRIKNLLNKGDLIFLPSSETYEDLGLSALVNETLDNTAFSYHVIRFQFKYNIDHSFRKYLTNNHSVLSHFIREGKGTTRKIIGRNVFRNAIVVLPPKQEQTKIANYLDKKTAQIDNAISLKEQMIERLKERRQIIINDAVTKGLDKNVKMKDSGVEWIGEISEHWEVKKFKYIFTFSKGLNITKENLEDEGIPCINYGEIHSKYGFEVIPEKHNLKCVNPSYLKNNQKSFLNNGDFVFADTSEDIEGSGNFTYLNSKTRIFAGYHTVIARSRNDNFEKRYIAYLFDSINFRNQIRRQVKGVKVYSITNGILKKLFLLQPPKKEQKYIIDFIDKETSKIDNAINLQQKQIDKLKEYKTTLIDSVVTGKVRITL